LQQSIEYGRQLGAAVLPGGEDKSGFGSFP
jgi:hypothetical protein